MENTNQPQSSFAKFFKKNRWSILIGAILLISTIYSYINNPTSTEAVLASMVRHATPLILGALCGLIGERSGIINIGIEGQMLMAAFLSFMVASSTGNLVLGVIVGLATGALLGLLLAFMSVTLKVDQIIGGTVLNILAIGLTGYFYQVGAASGGKFAPIPLGPLADIPLIGRVLFNNPPITYVTLILVFVVHYVMFHTTWGLRTRAIGEHPRAADTVGVNVFVMRYVNTVIAGAIGGLAGAFLTMEAVGSFERAMTNGRGFVALAVMLFGQYTPFGALGAALLFGFASAMQTQLQFAGTVDIPHQFIGMIPYVLTIAVLAGFVGRSRPPAAAGTIYEKEG
ncbi:MAG TPA: ABC transporter permease [Anaerolineales bacterium]|nr:ABC transporter permease [Anaerolineales bacterium]